MIEIAHRDFRDTLARCAELGGADLIVTSPPYPDARPGQYGGDAPHDWTWQDYQALGDEVAAGLRPGGFCAINIDGPVRHWRDGVGSERSLIAFKLAIDWAERVGLRYVEHCAYVRDGTPGRFYDKWRSGWEPVHVFQRPGGEGYFDHRGFTYPAKHPGVRFIKGVQRAAEDRRGECKKERVAHDERALTTAIACVVANADGDHVAAFSSVLADAFVLCYSQPGALVCDPFTGSGTVAISAAKHGRRFIGGDLGARESDGRRWADIARERATAERDRPRQVALSL